jgi:protein-S-isoprenylcysteine O-methyltransferase Ste14
MSHRTADLPPLTGIAHVIRELRYHEVARQSLAVVLILVYAVTAAPIPLLAAIGLPVALAGAFWRLYASGFIVKNQELATDGAYRFVRHPLYTGNILLVMGFALAGSRWWGLPVAVLFFWFYYPAAIEYEDRKLHRLFGTAWETWSARTPALMPRFGNVSAPAPGDRRWSLAVSAKRNGELVLIAFELICAAWVAWIAFR